MHECPNCGYACDCDGEDTWWDDYPSCACDCDAQDDDDYYSDGQEEIEEAT